ncbi:MAG TPA: hypothetical protein VHS56_14420 [Candidatus Cybelea sp.]|jgi:hypothetical protein|nr:hypothetical protein [Candidatus Cybelea sp.]
MKISPVAFITFALLVGCGDGLATQSPAVVTNAGAHPSSAHSWMDPAAKADDLIYVSTFPFLRQNAVEIFSWRKQEFVGWLTDFVAPQRLCSDEAGDVFIPDAGTSQIFEYAHGTVTPIRTIDDKGHDPHACAVDDASGDLAVVDDGDVAIYRNASGTPKRHIDTHFAAYRFCGYDNAGNLFVDGTNHSARFRFDELPKDGQFLTNITLNEHILEPGAVQWDGKYIAIGDELGDLVFQFEIAGATGSLKGTVNLDGGDGPIRQFWIGKLSKGMVNPRATQIIAAQFHFTHHAGQLGIWDYPAGGVTPKQVINIGHPLGVTVSVATK